MKKLLWICILTLSFAFLIYAAGELVANENIAIAKETNCDRPKEADCDKKANNGNFKPAVQELKELIDHDPYVKMYFTQMIDQVPVYYDYPKKFPKPYRYLTSVNQMLCLINDALDKAPEYNETELVGFPINGILNWTMGVPAGFAAFRIEKVNQIFKKILDEYGSFLSGPDSRYVLKQDCGSWRSEDAKRALNMVQYEYEPKDKYWGFKSWNDFFIRKFKAIDKVRPIDGNGKPEVIVSACDSEVYNIQFNVQKSNLFWIKSQPYSLNDMLRSDKYADQFEGGDVYQAFLSATKYHRWRSPVSGTIKRVIIVPGTYYSATISEGMDPGSPNLSQGYIAHVATRALIFIEADPPVGLMCVMPIGMAEVSSCIVTVKEGQPIKKGNQLGYFQYGGSSYCLIFRQGVIKKFQNVDGKELKKGDAVNVRQQIAIAN